MTEEKTLPVKNHSLHEIADGEPQSLRLLAVACHNGACNPVGLLNSLADALKETPSEHWRVGGACHLDLKYVLGHVSYLLGESLGPSDRTVQDFARCIQPSE